MSDFVFLYWDDIGDSQEHVDHQRMKAQDIIDKRPDLVRQITKRLEKHNLEVRTNYRKDPDFDTCLINGGTYINVGLSKNNFLTDEDRSNLEKAFADEIGGIKFDVLTVWDYDYDEERSWLPSVGLTCDILQP